MTLNNQKAQFSLAYATAVASAVGCTVRHSPIDNDSVDLTMASSRSGTIRNKPELHLQLKATADPNVIQGNHIAFELPINNYNDLRDEATLVPYILVVMIVRPECTEWIEHQHSHTTLYKCAYWRSLAGLNAVTNSTSRVVHIPLAQQFTPTALDAIMDTVANGGRP